ncbi:MAG: hypothetical protein V4719_25520 [Planctomycetota bacterium]
MTPTPVPQSRTYTHSQCGLDTEISGQPFEVASNPMSDMTRTWCSECNAFFHISDFRWADTGETISDYYARHSVRATKLERFLVSKTLMVICAVTGIVLGGVGGYVLFRKDFLALRIFMVPFVAGVGVFVTCGLYVMLGYLITKRVCGVGDTRILT